MVDRSDPIAASAYSQSSSRDCSSRSSSRTKRGFEVPRVQNRSAYPRHSLGSRRAGMRSPLPKTGRDFVPPSSKASGLPAVDASGTPRLRRQASNHRPRQQRPPPPYGRDWEGRRQPRAAAPRPSQHRRRWVAPRAKQQRPRQELVPAPATRQVGSRPRPCQQPPPARWPPRRRGQPGGLPHGNSCRLGPPLEGILCGGQPTGMAWCGTGCRSWHRLKGLPESQTGRTLPPFAERKR
jgi:hypothetical protein